MLENVDSKQGEKNRKSVICPIWRSINKERM